MKTLVLVREERIEAENPPEDASLDGPESGQLAGEQRQGVEGGRSGREDGGQEGNDRAKGRKYWRSIAINWRPRVGNGRTIDI